MKKIFTGVFGALAVSAPLVLTASGGGPPTGPAGVWGPNSAAARVTSANWAGYVVLGGTYTSVSASWTQPSIKPAARLHLAGFWAGLDGITSSTVEQCGTSGATVDGKTFYWAWYEVFPAYAVPFSDAPVHPGDHIEATTAHRQGRYILTVADHTQGWRRTVHVRATGLARSSAEVIAEASSINGSPVALAHFSPVTFHGIRVGGSLIMNPVRVTMVLPSGRTAVSVPRFARNHFSVIWRR
jgi:Peptidase A4 family